MSTSSIRRRVAGYTPTVGWRRWTSTSLRRPAVVHDDRRLQRGRHGQHDGRRPSPALRRHLRHTRLFRILGIEPALGRNFQAADDRPGAEKVAIISNGLWQRDFGGTRDIVGRVVRLNGAPATIVGVMPRGFAFPYREDVWIPLHSQFPVLPRNDPRDRAPLVLALTKPGVSLDAANADAAVRRLSTGHPRQRSGQRRSPPPLRCFRCTTAMPAASTCWKRPVLRKQSCSSSPSAIQKALELVRLAGNRCPSSRVARVSAADRSATYEFMDLSSTPSVARPWAVPWNWAGTSWKCSVMTLWAGHRRFFHEGADQLELSRFHREERQPSCTSNTMPTSPN